MKFLIINGPNINLLGTRENEFYGTKTLDEINNKLKLFAEQKQISIEFFQSNIEGEIVNALHEAAKNKIQGIVINPAAYTHTSVAIRDAIAAIKITTIEVHLSNVYKREEFRHKSITAPVCKGQICGLGENGYQLALEALIDINKEQSLPPLT